MALGLIVNEMVTNAIKHAFPNNRKGCVHISFTPEPDQPWIMTISDDGCGMSAAKDTNEAAKKAPLNSGLGTRLTQTFAQTVKADINIQTSQDGTLFTLTEMRDDDVG